MKKHQAEGQKRWENGAKREEAMVNYSNGTDPFLQVETEVREER